MMAVAGGLAVGKVSGQGVWCGNGGC